MSVAGRPRSLLRKGDPAPVDWVNRDSPAPVLLVCEHAGRAIPAALGDLGLPEGIIDTHIGWDIGAGRLARRVAERLGAPLVSQRYSRLVIDCHRPPDSETAIPEESDGQTIPGNVGIDTLGRAARFREIFEPLNAALHAGFEIHPRRAAFSVHSYTPAMLGGPARPWHAGLLTRRDGATAEALIRHMAYAAPDLTLAVNEPYRNEDETDWFIPRFAEVRGLSHALIEIRNDQLLDTAGIERWAELLGNAIRALLETD